MGSGLFRVSAVNISMPMLLDPKIIDSQRFDTLWPQGLSVATDSVALRDLVNRTAMAVLRRQTQREAFSLWLVGYPTAKIAERLRRDPDAVHRTLHGAPARGLKGAVVLVREALEADENVNELTQAAEEPTAPLGRHAIAEWFKGAPPDRFVEMAALLAMAAVADSERRLTVADAYAAMPPSVVTHALPRLRFGGWIQTDGVRIVILKTPEDTNA